MSFLFPAADDQTVAPAVLQFGETLDLEGGKALEGRGRLYRKQVIYEGTFGKYDTQGKPVEEYPITRSDLHHWADSINLQNERGVKVDLPIRHVEDSPEDSRGEVLAGEVALDSKGRPSLYCTIKFRDAEAEKMANSAQVSLHQPLTFTDGKGNVYVRPIRHVCLTQNPVVPDLEQFTISASLTPAKQTPMLPKFLIDLAAKHNIVTKDQTQEQVETAVLALSMTPTKVTTDPPTKVTTDPVTTTMSLQATPAMVTMARDNRTHKLQGLVDNGKCSPAQAKSLAAQFCTDKGLSLSLTDPNHEDGFDSVLATMELAEPSTPTGEASEAQVLTFAQTKDPKTNPVIANAIKRAEAANPQAKA